MDCGLYTNSALKAEKIQFLYMTPKNLSFIQEPTLHEKEKLLRSFFLWPKCLKNHRVSVYTTPSQVLILPIFGAKIQICNMCVKNWASMVCIAFFSGWESCPASVNGAFFHGSDTWDMEKSLCAAAASQPSGSIVNTSMFDEWWPRVQFMTIASEQSCLKSRAFTRKPSKHSDVPSWRSNHVKNQKYYSIDFHFLRRPIVVEKGQ